MSPIGEAGVEIYFHRNQVIDPEIYSDLSVSCFFISVISNPQFYPPPSFEEFHLLTDIWNFNLPHVCVHQGALLLLDTADSGCSLLHGCKPHGRETWWGWCWHCYWIWVWWSNHVILLLLSVYSARMISVGSPIRRATTQNIWAIENTTTFFRW